MSGSIKANKIKAKNVVSGVQVQGELTGEGETLKEIAQTCGGNITAGEIDAESIVSGLQVLSEKTPASVDEFRQQVAELSKQVQRLLVVTPATEAKDVEEIGECLAKSEKELSVSQPSANRIRRWLTTVNDIAANVKGNVTTFTALAAAAKKLVETVGSLWG
ncbi:hypothetical protein ACFL6U_16120 [Planctomycetota bacterium]